MRLPSAFLLFALIAGHAAGAAGATPATASLAGTWTLQSAYDLYPDGHKTFSFGPSPAGILIVDAQGRYSLQIFRSNQPTFAIDSQGARKQFKANEIASTHYGHVALDPGGHTVSFSIERASNPRWNGTVQVRPYVLSGGTLSYQVTPQPGAESVAVSVWQRAGDRQIARQ